MWAILGSLAFPESIADIAAVAAASISLPSLLSQLTMGFLHALQSRILDQSPGSRASVIRLVSSHGDVLQERCFGIEHADHVA